MLQTAAVVHLSASDRIGEAIRRSLAYLPAEARATVQALLHPHALAIVAGTLAVWAGSHAVGIGQIVDVLLLVIGVSALGFAVFEGASELLDFATTAQAATSEADLEKAARHFARAVNLLGISTLQAILLRGQGKALIDRGYPPRIQPRPIVAEPPQPGGNRLLLWRLPRLPGGSLGETNAYGEIILARNQTLTEQRLTLFHELVHRYFSPRVGPFLKLRAEINMAAYSRSALLRYLEETLAEGYAQLRVYGLTSALQAIRFPLQGGYVTVSQLGAEGRAIGTITLGGMLLHVSITPGVRP